MECWFGQWEGGLATLRSRWQAWPVGARGGGGRDDGRFGRCSSCDGEVFGALRCSGRSVEVAMMAIMVSLNESGEVTCGCALSSDGEISQPSWMPDNRLEM